MSISQTSKRYASQIRVNLRELDMVADQWADEFRRVFTYTWPLAEMVEYNYVRTLESEGRWALYEGACVLARMLNMANDGWKQPERQQPRNEAGAALSAACNDFQRAERQKMVDEAHEQALKENR